MLESLSYYIVLCVVDGLFIRRYMFYHACVETSSWMAAAHLEEHAVLLCE